MADVEKNEVNPGEEAKEESTSEEQNAEGEAIEGEDTPPPAKSKKKLIAIVLAVIMVSVGAIGYTVIKKKKDAEEHAKIVEEEQASKKAEPIFHDMEEMIINLNTEGKGVSFMKLKITLEVDGSDNLKQVQKMMPKISDVFQMYLRELRPSDMHGSVGLYRLKEELLLRINKTIYPSKINDILFKEVLVQ